MSVISEKGRRSIDEDAKRQVPRDAGLIAKTEFDSAALPEAERVAAYQYIVAGPARMTALAEPFHAEFISYVVGPMRFHTVKAAPHRFERGAAKVAMDRLDQFVVQHLVRGAAEGDFDGRAMQAPEGSVYTFSFARPAVVWETGDVHLQLLTMGRRVAEERLGDLASLHGLVLTPEQAAPYTEHLGRVLPRLDGLKEADARPLVEQTLDVLAQVLGRAGQACPGPVDHDAAVLRQAQAHIEQRLASRELTPESVGEALRLSRTQLYALFQAQGGVARFIWARRLALVREALLRPSDRRSLAELALDYGFSNQGHLSTLFRRTYGEPPSRVRQNAAIGAETRR